MITIPALGLDDVCRFWMKVNRLSESECWLWTGASSKNRNESYRPYFSIKSIMFLASRVAYYIHYNVDPGNQLVCHDCPGGDNPSCVNPHHLWLGTNQENIQDSYNKGRNPSYGRTVISDEDIDNVRQLYATGNYNQKELGIMFGISHGYVNKIVRKINRV